MKTYSTKQAATKIGVSWITLQRYVTSGKIIVPPLQKAGGVTVRLWTERDINRVKKQLEKRKR
jgi:predicted site-specific integrase-resolvase